MEEIWALFLSLSEPSAGRPPVRPLCHYDHYLSCRPIPPGSWLRRLRLRTEQTSYQEPILSLTGISKQFPGVKALDNVDFSLLAGEVHALMGENGAGKSTLINIISGLLHPTSGKICVAGEEVVFASAIQAHKAGISTITQEFNLVPQLTVAENIFLGREPTARIGLLKWREIKHHASEVLSELGLNVPLGQRVSYLSVGDRQLVEIAKALSMEF